MNSLLPQLQNSESVLLMYLADELSTEDRAAVEQQLASDTSLRAQLEALRELHQATLATLQCGDTTHRLPVSEGVAVRRTTRMMRQWQLDNALSPVVEEPVKELRFAWWAYPLTTAAAVLIAFLVWWGNRPDTQPARVATQSEQPSPAPDLANWQAELAREYLIESFDSSEEDVVMLAINQPVDAGLERLNLTAARPDDVDAIFLNVTERNW